MLIDRLREKLDTLPSGPGVYVFHGRKREQVLYVGKARSLRSRVRSYFQPRTGDQRAFIAFLEKELEDIETFVVATEKEAALLENQLIKQHQPRYNVKLRDDKEFLSLRLDPRARWPRLEVVRRPKPDGAQYFGPYHSATSARQTLRLVNRYFQLRTCTDTEMAVRQRPCLQYQIKRCPGPCVLPVEEKQYREQVRNVALFLSGNHDKLIAELKAQMKTASSHLQYELAAHLRDQLQAVERVREGQRVVTVSTKKQDVLGYFREGEHAEFAVLQIREGKLVDVTTLEIRDVTVPDDEMVGSFVMEFYTNRSTPPAEIIVPIPLEAMTGIREYLQELHNAKITLVAPKRGPRMDLLRMATENAQHAFNEKRRSKEEQETKLRKVQEKLRLKNLPRRIECIDVSHTGGEDPVAAIVALEDGQPNKQRYRCYRVKQAPGGDDYASMHEILSRRFRRGRTKEQGWDLPDLLVIDGGRGQLNVALAVLHDLGIENMPVAALAKEKENVAGEKLLDRIYLPGQKNPIELQHEPSLAMLAIARNEAHRFSNAFREKRYKKRSLQTSLDHVAGIGKVTRTRLIRAFGSAQSVLEATDEQLLAAGTTRAQIAALRETVTPKPTTTPIPAKEDEDWAVDRAFQA